MIFANPWLLALLPLGAALLAWRWWSRPARPALALADLGALREAARPSWRLRLRWLPNALRVAALVLLIVAIARPQRGLAVTTVPEEGIDVALALDVSGSMQQRAELGERTSKLVAAKVAIDEFIRDLEGDRVGLVTFQATALLMSPLTLDRVALARQVWSVEPGLVVDGTAIGLGLSEAVNLLRDSPARSRVVVLLTDGENNAGEVPPLQAARIAETLGVRVYTIGFHGAAQSRGIVDVRLLQQIASTTGGAYYDASSPDEVEQAYESVRTLERSRVGERQFTEFEELAPRLAIAAILLLLAEAGLRATWLRRYP
ncbi:MAG: VWA domain-containing protein [Chloroflexi bacterium]|nr:VWA domain-containing protein [Chloroflexota bacterium]